EDMISAEDAVSVASEDTTSENEETVEEENNAPAGRRAAVGWTMAVVVCGLVLAVVAIWFAQRNNGLNQGQPTEQGEKSAGIAEDTSANPTRDSGAVIDSTAKHTAALDSMAVNHVAPEPEATKPPVTYEIIVGSFA